MTNSFFIPSDTKPGKSKISSLLKSLGFIERTSTPLWSYTYTRLRVDQVDFRDDYYEDVDWLYGTDFDTKWGIRISLHGTHKPEHRSLYQALTLIIAQIYETDVLFVNAKQQDVPGAEIEPNDVLNWDSVSAATSAIPPEQISIQSQDEAPESLPVKVEDDDMYLPEPTSGSQLVQVSVEEDEADDDWGDDDDWDDQEDEEEEDEEEDEVEDEDEDEDESYTSDDEEEDLWGSEEQENQTQDDGEEAHFDGIVKWD